MDTGRTDDKDNWATENRWTLWYHSVKDNNWTQDSYKKIFTISNLGDYEILKVILKKTHLQNSMLFLMKDEILPIWEDPENIDGCSVSFKIVGNDVVNEWNDIILSVITNDILLKEENNINGISISPKKEFNIVKLWTKDIIKVYSEGFKEYGTCFCDKNVIIKPHN